MDAGSAARLFAEAAQASDVSVRRSAVPWAKYQLGKLYIQGNGVPRDWAKAEELLRSAAQDGNEFAQRLLQRRAQWHRLGPMDAALGVIGSLCRVPFPVSWTVKMKKKQKETQDILSYHTQAAGCSDKARAKAFGGRQPIEECGRTGL